MHILAKRILTEQVAPVLEKMLDSDPKTKVTETEFEWAKDQICMAKELLECDVMLKKMDEYDSDTHKAGTYPTGPTGGSAGTMNL